MNLGSRPVCCQPRLRSDRGWLPVIESVAADKCVQLYQGRVAQKVRRHGILERCAPRCQRRSRASKKAWRGLVSAPKPPPVSLSMGDPDARENIYECEPQGPSEFDFLAMSLRQTVAVLRILECSVSNKLKDAPNNTPSRISSLTQAAIAFKALE